MRKRGIEGRVAALHILLQRLEGIASRRIGSVLIVNAMPSQILGTADGHRGDVRSSMGRTSSLVEGPLGPTIVIEQA